MAPFSRYGRDVRRGEVPTPRPLGGPKRTTRPGQSERVKGLGGATGPINTLDGPPLANSRRQPGTTLSSTDSAFAGGLKRRQDYDGESSPGNRASKRLRPGPGPSRDAVRLSQDDANDAESIGTSTASNDDPRPKQKECTNRLRQNEFRSTSMGSPSSRRRRNRKKPPVGARERRSSEVFQHNSELRKSTSPDELRNSSPRPVVSDLLPPGASALPKSARPAQTYTKPGSLPFEAAKHRRKNDQTEEISDDELANDNTKRGGKTKPQASLNSAKCRSTRLGPKMRLRQAVCGARTFQPEKDVELVRNDPGTVWKLVTGDGKPIRHPWLLLDVERMNKISHSPDSEIVTILRPQTKTIPSTLVLQFEHKKASRQFILEVEEAASGTVKSEPRSPTFLTGVYKRSLDTARRSCSREPPETLALGDDPEAASFCATSPRPGNEARRNQATGERRAPNARLIDGLLTRGAGENSVSPRSSPPPPKPPAILRTRRATRQSASDGLFADKDLFLPRWSLDNTAWKKDWGRELVYPSTGRNRATVHKEDIYRLDEGAFLNDSLVFCYIRYLQEEMERKQPDIAKRIYFMNTYFFEILRKAKGGLINYEGVKSWTSKVDIFSYDYIVVPVNEDTHWYLAIICNPRVVIECNNDTDDDVVCLDSGEEVRRDSLTSPRTRRKYEFGSRSSPTSPTKSLRAHEKEQPGTARRVDSKDIRIITLDSLGSAHSKTCQMLRSYLVEEAKTRKDLDPSQLNKKIGFTAKNIPGQANFCDCGVFLLGYAQRFLEDPDGFVATILQRGKPEWTVDASQLRNQVRETLFRLHKEYREELANRKSDKRKKIGGGTQEILSTGSNTPVSEALGRAASAPEQRDPPNYVQLAGGGDAPLSTPPRKQASDGRSVEPDFVNQLVEEPTSPRTSPPSAAPVKKSRAMASPQRETQSPNGCGTPNTGEDAKRWEEEEAKIRQSIEHDGDQSPSSSHSTGSSSNPSSTRGQPDQTDYMVGSPDFSTSGLPELPPTPLQQSVKKPDNACVGERPFVKQLSPTPMSTKSASSPVRGETPPRKREHKAIEIKDGDEPPRASKRAKETGKRSRYFGPGDDVDQKFVPRKYDTRTFQFEGGRKKGQGRRSSDAIDLTQKD